MASVEAPVAPVGSVAEAPDAGVDADTPDAAGDAGAGDEGGERWGAEHRESGPCVPHAEKPDEETLAEPNGPRKLFSYHGYRAWTMRVQRTIDRKLRTHCVQVAFPAGKRNSDDKPVTVAAHIDDGWLRAIENTLQRLPWRHLQVVRRVVIDDRPKEHGIAPFDRRSADDGRDGRTLWLHERLFTEPNHWAHGNHGRYWSYHTDIDGETLDNRPNDHARFSPVMLHEIGHLVAYNVVNHNPANEAVPACARVCGDRPGGCKGMLAAVREQGCISAYCMPFQFETGTENWAEMYRFHYQSAATRSLLTTAEAACVQQLDTINDGRAAPWALGLPDIADFRRTLWKSCDERPCKRW